MKVLFATTNPAKVKKYAERLKEKTGCKIVSLNHADEYVKYSDKFCDYAPFDVGPREWINLVANAEYVLTDSFHGTCFSIIYNKNFIDILPSITGTRISSILKLFDLESRITTGDNYNLAMENIDYDKLNKKLVVEQKKSINALKEALEKCGVRYE